MRKKVLSANKERAFCKCIRPVLSGYTNPKQIARPNMKNPRKNVALKATTSAPDRGKMSS